MEIAFPHIEAVIKENYGEKIDLQTMLARNANIYVNPALFPPSARFNQVPQNNNAPPTPNVPFTFDNKWTAKLVV